MVTKIASAKSKVKFLTEECGIFFLEFGDTAIIAFRAIAIIIWKVDNFVAKAGF